MQDMKSRTATAMRKSALWLQAAVIVGAGIVPILAVNSASAASEQLINREARITNATPSATFDVTFEVDTPTNAGEAVQGIEFEFVDDPLAGYTGLPANTPTVSGATLSATQTNWNATPVFTGLVNENGDNYTGGGTPNNQLVITRTNAAAEDNSTDKAITFTGLTHNATANKTFYVRLRMYSDTARTTLVFEGVVAQSTSQTLNVSARVQERLEFCVGSTLVNDAAADPGANCAAITGNNVDIGVVDSDLSTTPVALIDGGNNSNGIAMVNTNAVNGTVVSYAAIQEPAVTGAGKLKVDGQSCADNISVVDQCFNSVGATRAAIVAGTEKFGMTIGGVNCGSSSDVGYTCDYPTGLVNLRPQTAYIGGTFTAGAASTYGASGFAWVDDGTYTNIASSGASTVKVIEDEALILRFGATAASTTPTGRYDVDVDFVATPTF